MLGYMSSINKEVLNDRFNTIHYLLGDFDVIVYSSLPSKGWIEAGKGSASYQLEDTFITEKIRLVKEHRIITMNNTIGCDAERDTFRLFTLDTDIGAMNVFKGSILDNILIFNNIESDIKIKNEFGDCYAFKLIYKQLSELENELVVGCSKDNGKTWFPFLKNRYLRKLNV